MPASPDPNRLRWNWEINVGSLAERLVLGAIVVAGFLYTNAGKVDRMQDAQATMTSQLAELKAALSEGLKDIRQQIAALPDQRARLEAVERRLDQGDAHDSAIEARLGKVERDTIELRSDLNNVTRASQVPLGRGK